MTRTISSRPSRLACRTLVALAAWPLAIEAADLALPAGAQVVQGRARIVTSGPQMTVTTSRNAAIDWRSFSIGPQAAVRFDQPDASSQVLSRVLGRDPSRILGRLSSNGEVWLLNPYGVLFGRDARVDVGGLVASTLSLGPADWAAGRRALSWMSGLDAAPLVNEGDLRSASGGRVLLVGAGEVRNDGRIDSPEGRVGLLATASVDLADSRHPEIAVRVDRNAGTVLNRGTIEAAGGTIDLQGAMVNQQGVVRADSLGIGPGGSVLLRSADTLNAQTGSVTSATGATGGRIDLVGGTQSVQGRLDVSGRDGPGGQIGLAAPHIALLDGAVLQASGTSAGGTIHIGLAHDAGAAFEPAAQAVFVGPGASLAADARQHGDGGSIHLWSDATRAYGRFSARGGALGGNGGLVETSGSGVDAQPAGIDTRAPSGRAGQWLLDPLNVQIVQDDVPTVLPLSPDRIFSPLTSGTQVRTGTLALALVDGNVTISTGGTGNEAGNITMENVLFAEPLARAVNAADDNNIARTLTLQAASGIRLTGSTIESTRGLLSLQLLAGDAVTLANSSLSMRGNLTVRGSSFTSETSTSTAARVDLQANRVRLDTQRPAPGGGSLPVLQATDVGDALVLRGLVDNIDSFTSVPGTGVLRTSAGGRWLLYARDPSSTSLGGLDYTFKQYGATYPSTPAQTVGNGLLYAAQPVLGVSATGLPLDKVYDGTTTLVLSRAQLDTIGLTGLVGNDRAVFTPGLFAGAAYASLNAGLAVPITTSLTEGLPTIRDGDRRVYGYGYSGQGLAGTITPARVDLSSANVADKVYDGTVVGRVTGGSLAGVLPGDTVTVSTTSATFADPNAGIAKPVLAQALALGGADAGNYRLGTDAVSTTASIERGTLTYRAQPVTVVDGAPWPALTGSVSGFAAGETLATATAGALQFRSPATAASPPGIYAVLGSGLIGANYTLVQDPANASALRVLPLGSDDGLSRLLPQPGWNPPLQPATGGPIVAVPPPTSEGFVPLDIRGTPPRQLGAQMRARTLAMDHAFRTDMSALNAEPSLARLPDCADVAGALRGDCILTPALRDVLAALWTQRPAWGDAWAGLERDELFERMFWRHDTDL
ncbi:MAG: filamentous hemagglutinin N-terminal domain-containing protein, partial [Caldimonas sp.]